MVKSDDKFDKWLLEDTRQMALQVMLDACEDYFASVSDLEQAQELLKPSIRPPEPEDWERIAKILWWHSRQDHLEHFQVYYTTQQGVLPPLSHLQK